MKSAPAPTPPPAPTPIDPAKSALDYINAMADPALQQRLLDAERTNRPEYTKLNLQDLNQYLYGAGGQEGTIGLLGRASQDLAQFDAQALAQQRAADIAAVEQLGGRASAAFREANPQLNAALQRADGLAGSGDIYAGLQGAIAGQPQFGNISASLASPVSSVSAGQVGSGALGESLNQQALAAGGLGQVGGLLQGRAAELAQSRGQLSPDELRSLQQSVREGYAARGVELGSGAISGEALARLTNERQRAQEDLALASQLNQGNQAELNANRAFQQSVQGADISRQFGNVQNRLSADFANQGVSAQQSLANQSIYLATQDANRAFAAQQYQQGIANQGLLGQLRASQLAQDRGYALNLAGLQQAVASDPFQAILGRPSQALGMAQQQQGFGAGLASGMQGPQLFDPNAGINLGLMNNANLTNYNTSIYGSQLGLLGANQQAKGAMVGGIISGLGAIGGGFASRGCWVARAAYGHLNPKWQVFRYWLFTCAPYWFRRLYLAHGERFAAFIADKPRIKAAIRWWMDKQINSWLASDKA